MSTLYVSIRLDEVTMARVDALGPLFSSEWCRATRSDILRALILVALKHYEREVASPPSRPRPRGTAPPGAAAPASARARHGKAGAASPSASPSASSAGKKTAAPQKRKRAKKGARAGKG